MISSYVVLIVHFSITVQTLKNQTKKVTVKFNENGKKKYLKHLLQNFEKNIKKLFLTLKAKKQTIFIL